MKIILTMLFFALPYSALADYTDQELEEMSFYQLEMLGKRDVAKNQRDLVSRLKSTKEHPDCNKLRDEYWEMSFQELEKLKKTKKSKSEKEIYAWFVKNKKIFDQLNSSNYVYPSVSKDDFTDETHVETRLSANVTWRKYDCPFVKDKTFSYVPNAWKAPSESLNKSMLRGTFLPDGESIIQAYFVLREGVSEANANVALMESHFSTYRTVSKLLGELPFTLIDFQSESLGGDYNATLKRNNTGFTTGYSHIAVTLTVEQINRLYEKGDDEPIRVYRNAGKNIDTVIPYKHIKVFNETLQQESLIH